MFKNITVIGSGVMGSAIAAHLTNAGCNVNLLDIITDKSKNRNYLADEALKKLTKIKPSPITKKSNLKRIITGNIEDIGLNLIGVNTNNGIRRYYIRYNCISILSF